MKSSKVLVTRNIKITLEQDKLIKRRFNRSFSKFMRSFLDSYFALNNKSNKNEIENITFRQQLDEKDKKISELKYLLKLK